LVFDKLSISDSSSPTLAPCTVYVADALVQTTHPNVRIRQPTIAPLIPLPELISPLSSLRLPTTLVTPKSHTTPPSSSPPGTIPGNYHRRAPSIGIRSEQSKVVPLLLCLPRLGRGVWDQSSWGTSLMCLPESVGSERQIR
jgi:hypothetical protein